MATKIQLRRDTAANWTTNNPILGPGEVGVDLTSQTFKIGDGTSSWTTLEYSTASDATTTAKGLVELATDGENAAGVVVQGNDARLSDARTPSSHTHPASEVSDFDTEVSNNSAVAANTSKVSNATHTGDVTGDGALTIASTAISGKSLVTGVAGMEVLVDDSGTLKKVDVDDLLGGAAPASASTTVEGIIELATITETNTGSATNRAITPAGLAGSALATAVTANTSKETNATHTGDVTGSGALTIDPTAISGKASVTPANGMEVMINDGGTIKKSLVNDFLGGGGGAGGTTQEGAGSSNLSIKPADEGTVTGNARGCNAVDLQSTRGAATQVASGDMAFIGSGNNNSAPYPRAVVAGGSNNTACGYYPVGAFAYGPAFVGGGNNNNALGGGDVIGGGISNTTDSAVYLNTIGGGYGNTTYGFVGGGQFNCISAAAGFDASAILGGSGNTMNHGCSMIVGQGITSNRINTTFVNNLSIMNIPTSAPAEAGAVWSNSGVLTIV